MLKALDARVPAVRIGAAQRLIGAQPVGALSLPVIMLLESMSSAVPTATKLVRHAPAYQGDASDRAMANTNTLVVKWQENDREAFADLDVTYELRNFDGDVTVPALPDVRAVGILLTRSSISQREQCCDPAVGPMRRRVSCRRESS